MADSLDRLAADIMDDMARTTDKVKLFAKSANWTAEEALEKLATMFRELAAKRRSA